MDEKQKQALLVYIAIALFLGYMGHTNLVVPAQRRAKAALKEVDELKEKRENYISAKKDFDEQSKKFADVKVTLESLMARFPKPKGREGEQQKKVYDTFSISEQISSAAQGLVLAPKEPVEPEHFFFQSQLVVDEDLNAKAEAMQDPGNKENAPQGKEHIFNFLSVDQPRYRFLLTGDYKAIVAFVDKLASQQTFFDITSLDMWQRGTQGTSVQANVVISCLDLSDGLVSPAP